MERRGVEERDQRDHSLEAGAPRLVRLERALWTSAAAAAAATTDDGGGERGQPGTRGPAEHGGERGAKPRGVEAAEQTTQLVLKPEVVQHVAIWVQAEQTLTHLFPEPLPESIEVILPRQAEHPSVRTRER